jgi:hypothetical protein
MDIHMSDIMLHIDENLNLKEQATLESQMREQTGVIGLGYHSTQPHLMIVEYDMDCTNPKNLLHTVQDYGLHAELVGFL